MLLTFLLQILLINSCGCAKFEATVSYQSEADSQCANFIIVGVPWNLTCVYNNTENDVLRLNWYRNPGSVLVASYTANGPTSISDTFASRITKGVFEDRQFAHILMFANASIEDGDDDRTEFICNVEVSVDGNHENTDTFVGNTSLNDVIHELLLESDLDITSITPDVVLEDIVEMIKGFDEFNLNIQATGDKDFIPPSVEVTQIADVEERQVASCWGQQGQTLTFCSSPISSKGLDSGAYYYEIILEQCSVQKTYHFSLNIIEENKEVAHVAVVGIIFFPSGMEVWSIIFCVIAGGVIIGGAIYFSKKF